MKLHSGVTPGTDSQSLNIAVFIRIHYERDDAQDTLFNSTFVSLFSFDYVRIVCDLAEDSP